jgi:hypothetical protein
MELELRLRIVLEEPPAGVDFGLQLGKGTDYQTIQTQRSNTGNLEFEGSVTVKDNRADGLPNFLGPLAQGPPTQRFIYVDVGAYAGQPHARWGRRIKIPLGGIGWDTIKKVTGQSGAALEARIPGTGKDGGPTCATVRCEWKLIRG